MKKKDEIKVSPPIKRKRARSVAAAEAARERWEILEAQIEFPILKPKPIDAPLGPIEEEPQIEGILFENRLLKKEVQALIKELENWKEACRKQGERKLHTLVEAANQLEGPNSIEPGNEEERVVCPTCREIFKEAESKIVMHALTIQKYAPAMEEVVEKEYVVTQEPTSLNILAEVATNSGTEEPRDEVIPDCGDEDCTMTPESSHDT